jgi:hypothetical protein
VGKERRSNILFLHCSISFIFCLFVPIYASTTSVYQFGNLRSIPQSGFTNLCDLVLYRLLRTTRSSESRRMIWKFEAMREGVTDLGRTTTSRATERDGGWEGQSSQGGGGRRGRRTDLGS